jgi:hypothetical protein
MKKNIVFIVNIVNESNTKRSRPYVYSINSWKKWCEKNDCELFVLKDRIYDTDVMNPNWHKLFVFDLLDNEGIEYDQIAIADADTIVHPDCPNFFETSEHKFCAVHNEGCYDWISRSIENYSKHLFDNHKLDIWKYINSGFMVVNKEHKDLFSDIIKFYLSNKDLIVSIQETFSVGTDQPIINFFLDINKISCKLLPYEFNMCDMYRKEILDDSLTFTDVGWIYHYNSIPNNGEGDVGFHFMKKTYEKLYETYEERTL